jgi:hypothetical protein
MAGGIVGAGVGGVRNYQQAREQGAGVGEAVSSGVAGAAKGGLIGGGIGAAAGGAGGALMHNIKSPAEMGTLMQRAKEVPILGRGAGFGQSQAHLLTGWKPKGGLQELGVGASNTINRMGSVADRIAALKKSTPGALAPEQQSRLARLRMAVAGGHEADTARRLGKLTGEQDRLHKAMDAGLEAERRGMTNIPGYVKSLASDPAGTLGTALKQRWHEQGTLGKTLMFGLPAAMGARDILKDDPERGHGERLLSAAGNMAGSFAFTPMSMVGDAVLGMNLGTGAARLGKRIDQLAGHKPVGGLIPPRPHGTDLEEHNIGAPVERIETDRFRGMAPEGGVG